MTKCIPRITWFSVMVTLTYFKHKSNHNCRFHLRVPLQKTTSSHYDNCTSVAAMLSRQYKPCYRHMYGWLGFNGILSTQVVTPLVNSNFGNKSKQRHLKSEKILQIRNFCNFSRPYHCLHHRLPLPQILDNLRDGHSLSLPECNTNTHKKSSAFQTSHKFIYATDC